MINKKAVSAIVATIMVILLTVAAMAVIWVLVLPMLRDVGLENYGVNLNVELDGYTAYDSEHDFAFVQISRGVDEYEIISLNVIFDVGGSSVKYRVDEVPEKNGAMIYVFDFGGDGVGGIPSSVKIAPIILDGNSEKVGEAVAEVDVPNVEVYVDDWDEVKNDSMKSYLDL